jgi:hypothetical protein
MDIMAMKRGSIVLSPEQARVANNVLQNAMARQNVSPDVSKSAWALYGNIYQFPNYGRYRSRYYVEQDSSQGLDALSRTLLLRWSREMTSQQGWIEAAIRILAQFAVGDAYLPEYVGDNTAWGKEATDWLVEEFYPNCCTRGSAFDFQTTMFLESQMMDIDGDLLCVYGKSSTGFPKFQIVPSHRIRSYSINESVYSSTQNEPGPITGTVMSDGVLYNMEGTPLGYQIVNYNNLVNSLATRAEDTIISVRDAMLVFDPRYFDKGRGRPSIGSAILQALSLQEIETYLMEKIKIESCVGLVEKTPSGEGPLELQQTLAALNASAATAGVFTPSANVHGVEIVDGPTMRYVKASGGDIQTLQSNTPADQTSNYISRLEQAVLSTLGVPSVLLLNPGEISGRISDGVGEIFNRSVKRRQKILDGHGKFIIAWALANAMQEGLISTNYKENIFKVFQLTHPAPFSLNKGYDDASDLKGYEAGTMSLNEIVKKRNTTAKKVMEEIEAETTDFFVRAKRIAATTGVDLPTVLQSMKGMVAPKVVPQASPVGEEVKQ